VAPEDCSSTRLITHSEEYYAEKILIGNQSIYKTRFYLCFIHFSAIPRLGIPELNM